MSDDDLVPVSVRLGNVVPPEDPEDWTRPLTWVAALGMLAGPLVALVWFIAAPPTDSSATVPVTYLVAGSLAGGAALTGATQIGLARAWTATLGAGLFGSLVVIILGVVMAGERQVGAASPTLAHAFAAAVAGLAGAAVAALVAASIARVRSRLIRFIPALVAGVLVAVLTTPLLLNAESAPLSIDARTCRAEVADHLVVVKYPADWWAGGPGGDGRACQWFASAAAADSAVVQIILGAAGGGPEPIRARDIASERRAVIDGRRALRTEYVGSAPDGSAVRRLTYQISLGETLNAGPTIIVTTDNARPGGYAANVAVLDRIVQLMTIEPTR